MVGKSFETVLCLLSIGVLQHIAAFGCQTNSDCSSETTTGSTKQCCYDVDPPRCMNWAMCYLYRQDNTKPTPAYPKFTVPYNRFTLPDYDKFTVPDFNQFTVPNIDHIDVPTFSYKPDNDDYDYGGGDNSTGYSTGAPIGIVVSVLLLTLLIFWLRCVRCRANLNRSSQQRNCNVLPPATTNTSRTNLAAQQREEPSRIVIIAVTRDEDHIRNQNLPPDGEPPFLSEEDILHNLHNSRAAQQPPPYEEAVTESHLPQYEGVDNAAMDQPPPPAYSGVQATPPNVDPPSYQEALTSSD